MATPSTITTKEAPKTKAKAASKLTETDVVLRALGAATAEYAKANGSCHHSVVDYLVRAAGVSAEEAEVLLGTPAAGAGTEVEVTFKFLIPGGNINMKYAKEHLARSETLVQAAGELLTGSRYAFNGKEGTVRAQPISTEAVFTTGVTL
jgi:hypothetical protein